jgi:hypothetical protein
MVHGTSSIEEISERLIAAGFTNRKLTDFQLRDLQRLLSLQNGANDGGPYVRHLRSCLLAEESIANSRAGHRSKSDHGIFQR